MTLPSKAEIKDVIVGILTRARNEDRLGDLTVRIVLREVATHYGIEEDVLQSSSYKPFIKETVYATMNSFNAEQSEGEAHPPERKVDEEQQGGSSNAGKRKRPSTAEGPSSDKEHSEHEALPAKKASARGGPSKVKDGLTIDNQAKPGKTAKKPKSDANHKSKAIIESSDGEAKPESSIRKAAPSPKKEKPSTKSLSKDKKQRKAKKVDSNVETDPPAGSPKEKTPASSVPQKSRQHKKADKDDSDAEMDFGQDPGPSSSGSKPKSATESPKRSISKAKELNRDPMESELSSVIDEPPTKRHRKKQEKESMKFQKDEKPKRGKKKEPLSREEETINKLKSMVVACGVRKVWRKEFEGLDKPSQQIKRLHLILGDLGMTPRYCMEKARTIREQRELAQELKEVQDFDKAMKRHGKGLHSSSEIAESVDQDDSDGDVHVPARKKNARASIMAFLQDQSEEE